MSNTEKKYIKQHIVPKVYLDRFASIVNGKRLIGTYIKDNKTLIIKSTSDVGFIKNYYDVEDKKDSKYWEHYLASIDSLYGGKLGNIICSITLSYGKKVLTDEDKKVLSKIIFSQIVRIPYSLNHVFSVYPSVSKQAKEKIKSILPKEIIDKSLKLIDDTELSEVELKENLFNNLFDSNNFTKYCEILESKIWIVYINPYQNFPFITSDNPVLVESAINGTVGLFENGLINPMTCIFFPITPKIAVACYSNNGPLGQLLIQFEDKIVELDDCKFIKNKNIKLIEQSNHHAFIPHSLYNFINNLFCASNDSQNSFEVFQ